MPEKSIKVIGGSLKVNYKRSRFRRNGDDDDHDDSRVKITRVKIELDDESLKGREPADYLAPEDGRCTITVFYNEPEV